VDTPVDEVDRSLVRGALKEELLTFVDRHRSESAPTRGFRLAVVRDLDGITADKGQEEVKKTKVLIDTGNEVVKALRPVAFAIQKLVDTLSAAPPPADPTATDDETRAADQQWREASEAALNDAVRLLVVKFSRLANLPYARAGEAMARITYAPTVAATTDPVEFAQKTSLLDPARGVAHWQRMQTSLQLQRLELYKRMLEAQLAQASKQGKGKKGGKGRGSNAAAADEGSQRGGAGDGGAGSKGRGKGSGPAN